MTNRQFKGLALRRSRSKWGKRHKPGVMNKTERAYADLLEYRKIQGEVEQWHFEAVTLKLADGTRYTPDFYVVLADGMIGRPFSVAADMERASACSARAS